MNNKDLNFKKLIKLVTIINKKLFIPILLFVCILLYKCLSISNNKKYGVHKIWIERLLSIFVFLFLIELKEYIYI